MMTGFAENVLGLFYRKKRGGDYAGGAMMYIKNGLSENPKTRSLAKPLAVSYALLCLLAGFGMGNAAQMNSAAEVFYTSLRLPKIITGIVLAALAALIVFGGVKRISAVTARLVPVMSGFYIIGCLFILISFREQIPAAFRLIISSAFGARQIGGGLAGAAVRTAISMGFKRGVFSNEAGLGTSVFPHSQSRITEPVVCGMWSVFEIFFDTIVMCTLTALVLLVSPVRPDIQSVPEGVPSVTAGTQYFRLTDSDRMITDGVMLGDAIQTKIRGVHGEKLNVEIPRELTYSNIMTITGVERDGRIVSAKIEPLRGVGLAESAFTAKFGKPAGIVLAVLVAMFAFSTVIGWSFFGSQAAEFLFGERSRVPFCVIFITFSVLGACFEMSAAWGISDMLNGLMALPNLIAVLLLSPRVVRLTKEYSRRVFKKSR